ncbi:DUF3558 domain-containing protein [Amycolatopsis orientalis]|uniref:DUF3558 domain-containing protein n=1 Tax=Amycolatopsis orientalis TaxID=31958 RepID=UPI0003FA0F0F|nr:DUF3558 domain-containing protein [Amycolatopsis orientalis]
MTKTTTEVLVAGAVALAVVISGCSDRNSGVSVPTSAPSTVGVPAVTDPISNTAKAEADPCGVLSAAEIESIGGKVKRTRTEDLTTGVACTWVFEVSPTTVSAGLVTGNKNGLRSLYESNATGGLTTFRPVEPINGHPAVVYANGGEGQGTCTLAVGIRDDLVYTIIPRLSSDHPSFADPCGMATKVAAAAIKNLKKS